MDFVRLSNLPLEPDKAGDNGREKVRALSNLHLLPTYQEEDRRICIQNDFKSISSLLRTDRGDDLSVSARGFVTGIPYTLQPAPHTLIELDHTPLEDSPEFYAAVRNLIEFASSKDIPADHPPQEEEVLPYLGSHRVITNSTEIAAYVKDQISRAQIIQEEKSSAFAETAQYMGSKRSLRAFLVESVAPLLTHDSIVLDLMCGSGAAAAAFSQFWETIASDAQDFCRILAYVQGSGFQLKTANRVIEKLLPLARQHSRNLRDMVGSHLDREDQLFHQGLDDSLYNEYVEFLDQYPTYPSESESDDTIIDTQIKDRQQNPEKEPYLLFTRYFANTYFGVRQAVEIDSLRWALDQLDDSEHQRWALGALIITCSVLGSTYGGHFAQPKRVTEKNVAKLIDQRSHSVFHEFTIRLRNLARESEDKPNEIRNVDGPWRNALNEIERRYPNSDILVYLDAPYKRDEYSRYYHTLETLVDYNYPSAVGSGKIPSKLHGERFDSEFFTRSTDRMNKRLSTVIKAVIRRGWNCAWSYADNAVGNIPTILREVDAAYPVEAKTYATPSKHKSHRGQKPKEVSEYLVLLQPESTDP